MTQAISARSLAAIARQAATARASIGKATGEGHNTLVAIIAATVAIPQPAIRAGIWEAGPGTVTGRMNDSTSGVAALAITELTTPLNNTTKATMNIAIVATTVDCETSVPRQISTTQASPISACDRRRSSREPWKSTSNRFANEPKAMKYDIVGLPITLSANANSPGISIAARPARRSAA